MVFKPRQKRQKHDISIKINNCDIIVQTNEAVFLGVILDEDLSWKPHILNVSRKNFQSLLASYINQVFAFQQLPCVLCTFP